MDVSKCVASIADLNSRRSSFCVILAAASLLCIFFFLGNAFIQTDFQESLSKFGMPFYSLKNCKNQCRPSGSEALPRDIVSSTSNLETRPLWGWPNATNSSKSLLAMAVGIRQRDLVNKMVKKFLETSFKVMLFHYDGVVDEWKVFEWSDHVIHVSAINQTKWWFAKRFLHPDIVGDYDYIFLWDEDLGVENFDPRRYLSIVEGEGLEISQPALDNKSEVHHQITARGRRSKVHRRTFKPGDSGKRCDSNSSAPPCTGWIEMMAPVFSRAAWRCVWYMIQNDLIHAWGLDMRLGYCAQGDRTKNVGIVDAEYIVHHGLPTLGEVNKTKENSSALGNSSYYENLKKEATNGSHWDDPRIWVRRQAYSEFTIFKKRWKKAVENDQCWVEPYPDSKSSSV